MHHHHDLKVFSSSTSSNSDLCGPGDPDRLLHRCKFFHWLLTTSNKSNFYVTKVSILHHFRVTYIYFILHRLESASFLLHFVCSERVIDVRSVDNEVEWTWTDMHEAWSESEGDWYSKTDKMKQEADSPWGATMRCHWAEWATKILGCSPSSDTLHFTPAFGMLLPKAKLYM